MARRSTSNGDNAGATRAAGKAADHAQKAALAAGDAAELSYEELREQVATLKADLASLSETAQGLVAQKAREAADDADTIRRKALAAAKDGAEAAGEQLEEAAAQVETFARERPGVAMGLSAGAGFLLAMALTRR